MRVRIILLLPALACCLLLAAQARATDYAYGYTSISVDGNVVRGYHRTEVDYNTDVYYTPYVCASLYKDGTEVVRACGGGFASATRNTQTPYVSGLSYSALSDHYVNIEYEEEDPYNPGYYYYPDYLGYFFSGAGSQPIDWYYIASGIYNSRPDESIRLGDTSAVESKVHFKKVRFSNVSADFNSFNTATLNIRPAVGGSSACATDASNAFTIYIDFDLPLGANSIKHPDSRTFVGETEQQQVRYIAFGFQDVDYSTRKGTMWIKLFRIPSKPSDRVSFNITGTFSDKTGVWSGGARVHLKCQ